MSQPGVGLYLDTPSKPKVSPADSPVVWRELSVGIKTDTTNEIVIRRRWEEVERKTVTLEIRDHAGRPAAGHGVLWVGAGAPCGFFGIMFGPTDSAGRVDLEIPAELTSEIEIFQRAVGTAPPGNNGKLSVLSEEQRGRLVRDGWLAATLPPPE